MLDVPFKPFGITYFDVYNFSPETSDTMAFVKEQYPHFFNQNYIDLIHPDLMKDFFSSDNLANYNKIRIQKGNMERLLGDGLLSCEGDTWKKKRKILNNVFNFDFIKSLAPKIALLCDKVLDDLDNKFVGKTILYPIEDYTSDLTGEIIF